MTQILLSDIAAHVADTGAEFGATIRPEAVALHGLRRVGAMPPGLMLHTLDARAATDFETRARRAPGLVLHLVLAGAVEARIGAEALRLGCPPGGPARLAYYALAAEAPFWRRARAGEHLRKVSVAVDWDWLGARGVAREAVLAGRSFVQGDWPASPEEVALAERLVALDRAGAAGGGVAGQQIAREAATVALVARLIGRLLAPGAGAGLSPAEAERIGRIEAFAARPGPLPPLSEMAEAAGLSLSSARRLFRRAYGLSIGARLWDLRMARAEAALARGARVAGAAHLAGYASAESFATAFKRKFGLSPSELRPRARR